MPVIPALGRLSWGGCGGEGFRLAGATMSGFFLEGCGSHRGYMVERMHQGTIFWGCSFDYRKPEVPLFRNSKLPYIKGVNRSCC